MRKGKRVLAVFLTLSLVVGLCPGLAFAVPQDDIIYTPSEVQATSSVRDGYWGSCYWDISADGTLTIHPGTGEDTYGKPRWSGEYDLFTKVIFAQEGDSKVIAPADSHRLFADGSQIKSIDLSGFDTSHATNMGGLFDGCDALSKVTIGDKFSFKGAGDEVKVTLPDGNWLSDKNRFSVPSEYTSKQIAEDRNCTVDTYIKIPDNDPALIAGDGDSWGMGNPVGIIFEFDTDPSLISYIDVDDGSIDVRNQASEYVIDENSATLELVPAYLGTLMPGEHKIHFGFANGSCEASFTVEKTVFPVRGVWGDCPWEIDGYGILTIHPGTGEDTNGRARWAGEYSIIKKVVFAQEGDRKVIAPADLSNLFLDGSQIELIDLSGLDTSRTTNMSSMFNGCESLTSLDLSHFDSANVTDMSFAFGNCKSLVSLDLSSFNTSNVINMSGMFQSCSALTLLNLSSFNTANVTNMSGMFLLCSSLVSLDFSNFNTCRVTSMGAMFYGCSSLITLDLSSFNTAQVTEMSSGVLGMFSRCQSLASVNLTSFDTSKVREMFNMFLGCRSLTSLDLSNFDTSNVTNMHLMFADCSSLDSLNLSSFDTSQVINMGSMFRNCGKLRTVSLSDSFSFKGARDTVKTTLPEGKWFSSAEHRVLTPQEIAENRNDVKDTYTFVPDTLPTVSKDNDGNWTTGDSSGITFKTDANPALFVGVQVDGVEITDSDYTIGGNPAIITLKPEYLETISAGKHEITTVFANGTVKATFNVTKSIESAVELVLDKNKFTYDGAQKRPSVIVMCGSKALVEGTDYTVTYPASSVGIGTYTVTITGKGSYTGTKQATFEIVEASKPTPDEPKPDNPGSVDPKPDDPSTHPDNPGTTDPGPGNPGTQPEGPGIADPQPDNPGATDPTPDDGDKPGASDPEPVANQMMYRAYNPNSGEHFYTASYGEIEAIVAAGWQYEGEAWTAPVTSTVPVYRLYSGTDHHYTTSVVERDHLISVGWSDEGIGWYSDEAMGVGLHRLFNPNVNPNARRNNSGSHHYTTSDEERDFLVSIGWQYEGFGWYGIA